MPDPTFSQPERRSLFVPIVLGLALLGALAAAAIHFLVHPGQVEGTHLRTVLVPITTEFKTDTIMVGRSHTETALYVATTLRLDDQLKIPVYLDSITCTFTDPTGAVMQVAAFQKDDLPNLQSVFPALKPLLQTPLLRESRIDPGHPVEGAVLFSFPFTPEQWKARGSAVVQITLYHQPPVTITIPAGQ